MKYFKTFDIFPYIKINSLILESINSIKINYNFDIYFRDQHVKQRMEERSVEESEILKLLNISINKVLFFSFKTKFNIIRNEYDLNGKVLNPKSNSFMIRYITNKEEELSIPISIISKSETKFDIIVHSVMKFDELVLWQGQYVVYIHENDEAQLFQKISGKLIEIS